MKILGVLLSLLFFVKPIFAYTVDYTCVPVNGAGELIEFKLKYLGAVNILSQKHGFCVGQMNLVASQGKVLEMTAQMGGAQCRQGATLRFKDEYGILQTVHQRQMAVESLGASILYKCITGRKI